MMQFAHKHLKNIKGLKFYKLLGTGGGNGFRWDADFSVFAFLATWEHEEAADQFIQNSLLFSLYRENAEEIWTVYMLPVRSYGKWDGINPFSPVTEKKSKKIAVITRASIALKQLINFWRYVPSTSHSLKAYDGLIYSKGIGEWPVVQMATFSLWDDEESMKAFAYKNPLHQKVIRKTRELNWYTEELFARFSPVKTSGTWNGKKIII
jgi:hypothetical protein